MQKWNTYSWQVDVGNDDLVQSARRILLALAGVTTGVVLVCGVATGLPRLGVFCLGDAALAVVGGWVLTEVPAGQSECTGHDGQQDLVECEQSIRIWNETQEGRT